MEYSLKTQIIIEQMESECLNIRNSPKPSSNECCVPHVAFIGTLLLAIYVNDFPKSCRNIIMLLFPTQLIVST